MAPLDTVEETYRQEDHQVAYIFDPEEEERRKARPAKRRRVSKQTEPVIEEVQNTSTFVPLLNGAESLEFVHLRDSLYEESWAKIDDRIQGILRDSYRATLDEVGAFVEEARAGCDDKIPSAFIITGPNIASQDLLFGQLSETLQTSTSSKFVRLRSSEATTLKATLKKIIRDVTAKVSNDDEDDLHVGNGQDGRRYLDYDLEALYAFIKLQHCEHIFVAFQDSEGFDSSLLSELIVLFNSWRPRIPFTILFGIATSVELLQARLLKSACQLIYGAQFDVIQSAVILETIFKSAVAAADVPIRLGPSLLRSMLDRQRDQVSGVQTFIVALKYAYMCHFYANPLSILLAPAFQQEYITLQVEHFEAVRNFPSFRSHIEQAVEHSDSAGLDYAREMIENNDYLFSHLRSSSSQHSAWIEGFLRSLLLIQAAGAQEDDFSRAFVDAMEEGITVPEDSRIVEAIRKMDLLDLMGMVRLAISVLKEGDTDLGLGPSTNDKDIDLVIEFAKILESLEELKAKADEQGITVRSKYSGQSKVMRTTIIAQRVQLSQDSAALTDEDKQLTDIVDRVTSLLVSHIHAAAPKSVLFSEGWFYDSRAPWRDVFVPRPRAVLERSLTRPHDYLSCSCCKEGESGLQATLPATSILYHLYLETGNLINVADLWAAFVALVGEEEADERKTLVLFYRALAELRALGFVKASKKKADHIAKLKWL